MTPLLCPASGTVILQGHGLMPWARAEALGGARWVSSAAPPRCPWGLDAMWLLALSPAASSVCRNQRDVAQSVALGRISPRARPIRAHARAVAQEGFGSKPRPTEASRLLEAAGGWGWVVGAAHRGRASTTRRQFLHSIACFAVRCWTDGPGVDEAPSKGQKCRRTEVRGSLAQLWAWALVQRYRAGLYRTCVRGAECLRVSCLPFLSPHSGRPESSSSKAARRDSVARTREGRRVLKKATPMSVDPAYTGSGLISFM